MLCMDISIIFLKSDKFDFHGQSFLYAAVILGTRGNPGNQKVVTAGEW